MRAPEISHHVLLSVAAFLVGDNDATLVAKHRHSAWHCAIVGKAAVAVQFDPVRKTALNVIKSERPLIVAGGFGPPPGRQNVVKVLSGFSRFFLSLFSPPDPSARRC